MSQPSEHPDSPASDAPAPQHQAPRPYPGQQQQAQAPEYQASQPYAGQPQQQQFQRQYPQMSQQPPLPNPAQAWWKGS